MLSCGNITKYLTSIYRLQETGVISHWRSTIEGANNNYMRPYFKKLEKATAEPKKILLENLSGAFWLLLAGHLIATTVLIAENFLIYCKKVNNVVSAD